MKLSSFGSAEVPFAALHFPSSSRWDSQEVTQKVLGPALQESRFRLFRNECGRVSWDEVMEGKGAQKLLHTQG